MGPSRANGKGILPPPNLGRCHVLGPVPEMGGQARQPTDWACGGPKTGVFKTAQLALVLVQEMQKNGWQTHGEEVMLSLDELALVTVWVERAAWGNGGWEMHITGWGAGRGEKGQGRMVAQLKTKGEALKPKARCKPMGAEVK
ncbi:unnamed protein product [Prunus armeniaca]|uniref:Uncharacterized protein n=1 Tax=Prunus armeniaca TaxID=36596 RepID=A0A6J5UL44_PRUAR|nr:unnamed protein product [Prunus armeniaca]